MLNLHLYDLAGQIRLETFNAMSKAGGGHYGGSLSEIEILTVLYFAAMNIDPHSPDWKGRDRFILSKGHGGPGLYAVLAEKGYFPKEWLDELDGNGSRLPKHVDRLKAPGIDVSSGPLGQGLSIGVGMALAFKYQNLCNMVYVLLGDGECNEGLVWEGAMMAAKHRLDNVVALIDRNHLQVDGESDEIMPLGSLEQKWSAFGWHTQMVDGHSVDELRQAINVAKAKKDKPSVIIANTVKGKGVSYMESNGAWHSGTLSAEQYEQGLRDLKRGLS